jgi:hypothetical protein
VVDATRPRPGGLSMLPLTRPDGTQEFVTFLRPQVPGGVSGIP